MRLNKYLSESGACSRREADTFIEEGRVTVNGEPAALGTQVADGDDVRLDGEQIGSARKHTRPVYIALNKPVGITCTTERHVEGNIIDFVDHPERVFPIGRLDKDSEGLILLTNDGDIVNEVLRVENHHEKEYVVAVDRAITPELVAGMAAGVRLSDATTKPCKVTKLGAKVFRIVLTQGLNRQIRRMCEAFGFTVEALQRVRIMKIHLGQLPLGRWRNLTADELATLMPARDKPAPSKPAGKPPARAGSAQGRPSPQGGARGGYGHANGGGGGGRGGQGHGGSAGGGGRGQSHGGSAGGGGRGQSHGGGGHGGGHSGGGRSGGGHGRPAGGGGGRTRGRGSR